MVMTTDAEGSTLQLRDVRKSFPDPGDPINRRLVLPGISVTLAAGELVSLIGPSGCGKSTLLRLIAGLETADAGVLLIGSEAILGPSAERGLVLGVLRQVAQALGIALPREIVRHGPDILG